jgi:nucleotide-binding universal stress UspA family protein
LVYAYSLPIAGYAGYSMAPDDLGAIMRAEGTAMLREVAAGLRADHPALDVAIRLFQGDPVQALRRESEQARLTVVGSRGIGRVSGVLLGSVAMAITSHGTAPVAVVPAEGPGGSAGGPVVVGVDGSATSEAAIAFAFDEAAVRGVRLLAVHTWNDVRPTLVDPTMIDYAKLEDGERAELSEQLAGWREKYPDVDVRPIVVRGRPTQTLLRYAGQAELVVVGSRGRGGFAGMVLGSTSHTLITHAICPVVVVRPDSVR